MSRPATRAVKASVLAERYAAQLLTGPPAGTAEDVTARLLAIQGQDPRGARLAVRARSTGVSAADIDRALTVDRSLVISWLNRGTLHLVRSADYWPLHQLTTPPLRTTCARRLEQEGVPPQDADRAVALIERWLGQDGPLTRAQLAERLSAAGFRTQGQALVYLFFLASLRGILVRGPMLGKQHAYVLAHDWLGAPPAAPDRDAALGWLARRYLVGHAPATEADLAKWSGLPLRDARRGLAEIADQLDEHEDGLTALAHPAGTDQAAPLPTRLLGSFDPVLHGWQSREPVLGQHEPKIVLGGMFRPFAMVRGRAVATWVSGREVVLTPLEHIPAADRSALEADAADVQRFLGLTGPGR
jgi:hypothetical protein